MSPVHAGVKHVFKSDKYHDGNIMTFPSADVHWDLHNT